MLRHLKEIQRMEDLRITQTFQVQFLNSTLKFIKDDSQLLKEYLQMPSNHVEYLHNLICHYKSRLWLGFKSLYSPVFEAMQIYSVKYQFKITVEKSKDGLSGHLTMEKIPKNVTVKKKKEEEEENEKINPHQSEPLDTQPENEEPEKEEEEKEEPEKEEEEKEEPEKEEPQQKQQKKTTKKLSKASSKFLKNYKKILEAISPSFIERSLLSIMFYISDDWCVTKIFPDLTLSESKLLINIKSLAHRKNDFEEQLSEMSYEVLSYISDYFNGLTNSRLDITSKIDTESNIREVTFTKVPIFPRQKRAKKLLKQNSKNKSVTKNVKPKMRPNFNAKTKVSNDMNERELKENSKISTSKKAPKVSKSKKPPTIDRIIHSIQNMNIDSKFETVETNENLLNDSNNSEIPPENVSVNEETENNLETETIDNVSGTRNEDLSVNPPENVAVNEEIENNLETETVYYVPSGTSNALRRNVLRYGVSFAKEGTINTDYIENKSYGNDLWGTQIYQDMRVPITIEKAERMMRLMGWTGGALGPRGNGVMEPLIPTRNFKYTGLGHGSLKGGTKQDSATIPEEFGNHVSCMMNDEYEKASISAYGKYTDEEMEFWKNTVNALNRREKLDESISHTHHINNKMKEFPDITFSISFFDNDTRMLIKKNKPDETQKKTERSDSAITAPAKKNYFKRLILELIKELLKSGRNEIVLRFKKQIQPKFINCLFLFIRKINDRKKYIKMGQKFQNSMKSSTETSDRKELYLSAIINNTERTIILCIKVKQATDTDI